MSIELTQELKDKYTEFWRGNGVVLYLRTPNVMPKDSDRNRQWLDVDFRAEKEISQIRNASFFADAFGSIFANFGPGSLSSYIGGGFVPLEDTVWFDHSPIITDWENLPDLSLKEDEPLWHATRELTKRLCGEPDFYTSIADIGGTLDIAASLRGAQDILFDLYDYPQEVLDLARNIRRIWKDVYTRLSEYLLSQKDGMTSWMPIWCPGRYSPLQCDLSAMFSTDMFEEFVMPDLMDLTEFLDYSIYHLDGVGEIPHLDHILSIQKLNAVQWTAGAGKPDVTDECWFDMYDKIMNAGKGLALFTDQPEKLRPLLRHVSHRGLYIYSDKVTPELAEEIMKWAK